MLLDQADCPEEDDWRAQPLLAPHCSAHMPLDHVCEADGRCGTNAIASNCNSGPGGWNDRFPMYKHVPCLTCDAGRECGRCLRAAKREDCAHAMWGGAWRLHTCDKVEAGELCEADGECGTTEIDNCALLDLYTRVACDTPPSPSLPYPPPVMCGACDAGDECGVCLTKVKLEDCPTTWNLKHNLRDCYVAKKGEMCMADGRCGTSNDLDNCGAAYPSGSGERVAFRFPQAARFIATGWQRAGACPPRTSTNLDQPGRASGVQPGKKSFAFTITSGTVNTVPFAFRYEAPVATSPAETAEAAAVPASVEAASISNEVPTRGPTQAL
ncbi:MAG: hypothetical protein SGPRY_007795 [Prymnesium sp.]